MTDAPVDPDRSSGRAADTIHADDTRRLRRIMWVLTAVAAVLVGVLGVLLFLRSSGEEPVADYVSPWKGAVQLPDPIPAPTETFPDVEGTTVPVVQTAPGTVNLVFFGYTQCPDVCPLSMQALSAALDQLPDAERAKIRVSFITVDPERDTPDVLGTWLHHLSPSFTGLVPTLDQSNALLEKMGYAPTAREEMPGGAGYAVAHPGSIFVFTDDGEAHVIFTMHNTPDQIAADLRTLLGGWKETTT